MRRRGVNDDLKVPFGFGMNRGHLNRVPQGLIWRLATFRWCHAEDCTGRENPIPGSEILTKGSEIKAGAGQAS